MCCCTKWKALDGPSLSHNGKLEPEQGKAIDAVAIGLLMETLTIKRGNVVHSRINWAPDFHEIQGNLACYACIFSDIPDLTPTPVRRTLNKLHISVNVKEPAAAAKLP